MQFNINTKKAQYTCKTQDEVLSILGKIQLATDKNVNITIGNVTHKLDNWIAIFRSVK